jgi:hypothetical protein
MSDGKPEDTPPANESGALVGEPDQSNVRIADQPDNSTQARFEYAVLSFHALSSGNALRGNRRVSFGTFFFDPYELNRRPPI